MGKKRAVKLIVFAALILLFVLGITRRVLREDRSSAAVVYHGYVSTAMGDTTDFKEELQETINNYQNPDIKGRLIIDGTGIDELIMQSSNNDYYLNHNEKKEYEALGSIILDYRTTLDDKKVLVYGHSSIYRYVPFNELESYYDKDFYRKHKYIKVVTTEKIYTYEIFSVYVETDDFSYVNLKIDEDTYNKDLNKYKLRSLYDTGVEVEDDSDILILQTCSNSAKYKKYKKKFLLIIAKRLREE